MFDFLGNALGAIVSGGATGLLGAGITAFTELKKMGELHKHEQSMATINGENMRQEAAMDLQQAQVEGEIQITVEDSKLMAESYKHDTASYIDKAKGKFSRILFGFVDFFRGMVRPSLTMYLTILVTWLFVEILDLMAGIESALTKDEMLEILKQMILMTLYLWTTICLWWFGTRNKTSKGIPGGILHK